MSKKKNNKKVQQIPLFPAEAMSERIKEVLLNKITEIVNRKEDYVQNPERDFTRNRKINLQRLILLILTMTGKTLYSEINDFFKLSIDAPTVSAIIQQRNKVKSTLFKCLYETINDEIFTKKHYKGYRVEACDGSDITSVADEKSPNYMPNGKNKPFNQIHLNACYDLLNKYYTAVVVQPKPRVDERRAMIRMLADINEPTIVVMDRGYASQNLFEHFNRHPYAKMVIRLQNESISEIKALPYEELDTVVSCEIITTQTKKDKQKFAEGKAKYIPGASRLGKNKKVAWDFENHSVLTYRVVRFQLDNGIWETLATNLPQDKFSLEDLKELYRMRWGIETSFRDLKYTIGAKFLHSRKDDLILQEIYSAVLMYNLSSAVVENVILDKRDKCNTKYDYKINFKRAVENIKNFFRDIIDNLANRIAKELCPERPNRRRKKNVIESQQGYVYFCYRAA